MRNRHPELPSPVKLSEDFELPRFGNKYSFFGDKDAGLAKYGPQRCPPKRHLNLSASRSKQVNRHRYNDFQGNLDITQEVSSIRKSENLLAKSVCRRPSREKVSEEMKTKVSFKEKNRVVSVSQKAVTKKTDIKYLRRLSQSRDVSVDRQYRIAQRPQREVFRNKRTQSQQHQKRVKESRTGIGRQLEADNPRKSVSKCQNRSESPKRIEQEEKVNEIEVETVDVCYLMLVQNILGKICQAIKGQSPQTYQLCLCYITLDKTVQEGLLFQLLANVKHKCMLKEILALQRLVVYVVVYLQRSSPKKKVFSTLWQLVVNTFKCHSVLTDLILEIMSEMNKDNIKKYTIKQIGKQNKIKQILKYTSVIKRRLTEQLESREDKVLGLFRGLMASFYQIETPEYVNVIDKTLKWELMKMPSYPYLAPAAKPHTLVLDLDQTLIHFNPKVLKLQVRPHASEFIYKMSRLFQVVIFTAGTKQYADPLLDEVDPQRCISSRLYRNHITIQQQSPVKDLRQLGRDLNNTLIVDNIESNFRLQPLNGVLISSWYGDFQDTTLNKLCNVLKSIMKLYPYNLVEGLKRWKEYIRDHISYSTFICQVQKDI